MYTPLVESATPLAQELRGMREAFLSRLVYQTYAGYVMSQMGKLEQDLRNRGEIRWKHAMHLVRLLLAGIHLMKTGRIEADLREAARDASSLPEQPSSREGLDDLLRRVRIAS